ncbi:hypothetical protein [Ideonella sp. BN130291]|uniref:hypothetical protein n=1 Tax=Ideonella sp. BN130291 TaxID=3112940 RepID=UPI002E267B6F|nr:hypothetical protein [Ideonella sp. BN130291]
MTTAPSSLALADSPASSMPMPLVRDAAWRALCQELRDAQEARSQFMAQLGGRAYKHRHSLQMPLTPEESARMAALDAAIAEVDLRMRAFTEGDAGLAAG